MNIQLFQEILTYIIIAAAVYVAGYKIIIAIAGKKEGKGSCGTECSGCSTADIKRKHSGTGIIQE